MPDRTFLELQNEALHDDFSQTKYRALCKRYLNEAQRRIFRRARVPEGEPTSGSPGTVTITCVDSPSGTRARRKMRRCASLR